MSWLQLLFTTAFVGVALLLSMRQRLDLEKEIIIGAVRAAVQLILVGYVLLAVFAVESWWATGLMLFVMIVVAARNAAERARELPGVFWRILAALMVAEGITLALMLVLGIIEPTPQYVIPLSGMVIGNAMVVAGLFLNRLKAEIEARRGEIAVLLSLGATARQAVETALKGGVRAALIPTVDSLKTVGLVQLPGMMTGQILAGANPVDAVRYQILIMFSLTAAAALAAIVMGLLTYPLHFTRAHQMVVSR